MVTVKFHINCDPKTISYPGSILLQFLLAVAPNVNSAISVTNDKMEKTVEGIITDQELEICKRMIGINHTPFESGKVSINRTRIKALLSRYRQMKKVRYFLRVLESIDQDDDSLINLIVQVDPPFKEFTAPYPRKEPHNSSKDLSDSEFQSLTKQEQLDYLFG